MSTDRPGGRRDDLPAGPDDRALLQAHVDGDAAAFGTLFARHRDRLWAVALRTTGDREDAADALQDAMIAAFRRADSFRGDSAVTTWLHRIVVNACLDRLRRRKVRRTEALPDRLADLLDLRARLGSPVPASAAVVDPADLAVDHERRADVLAALASLPLDQRAALVLVDMEGYSIQEAAVILDCAPGTVKSRCSRGRARLLPLLLDHRAPGPRTDAPAASPDPPAAGSGNPRVAPRVRSSLDGANVPHDRQTQAGGPATSPTTSSPTTSGPTTSQEVRRRDT